MAQRRWHTLKGNKRCETAHNLIFFDTETDCERMPDGTEKDHLRFGWMLSMQRTGDGGWGPEKWERFSSVSDFWRSLGRRARRGVRWYVLCHNTNFDLPVIDIFGASVARGWTVDQAVIEGPPTIITLKRKGATLTFLDTLNWWRMPLAKIGAKFGLPKLDMPTRDASAEIWDEYCRRDVDVMKVAVLAWLAFLRDNDLGGFASTLAGQAFRTYRHRFMPHEIGIHGDEDALAVERAAYCGGRVECFRLGEQKGPIHGVDINSMYGAAMRLNAYPCKLLAFYREQDPARWARLIDDYAVVARCTVDAAAPCYPIKTKVGLCFPLGRFETALSTPEIALAIERRELVGMRDIALYEKQEIFTDYVDFMWDERSKAQFTGNDVDDWFFKHLLTNLYGKFGQTGQVYEAIDWIEDKRCMKYDIVDADTGRIYKARQLGGLLQVMSCQGEARDSFPAIAAHVTAYGRVMLWSLIEAAGLANVLYGDTDSLYVNAAGFRRLKPFINPKAIGKLKILGTWPWMTVHGLKDYELPGQVVRKGVRKDAVQEAPNRFNQVQWSSLKGLVAAGDVTAPTRKMVTKVLKREYRKGSPPR